MKQKRISVNSILNVTRKLISLLFPIISLPYAIRVLGVDNVGKVNYGHSIITFFGLIAMLGVSQYAIREGAKRKDNKKEFNTFANEIFTINLCSTIISYLILILCILFVPKFDGYGVLLLIQSVSILLTTLSVDWINTVYEDFLLITIRSIVAYLIMLACLFIFVRKPEDYYYYALLTVIFDSVVCVTNLIYCRKYANIHPTLHPHFRTHLKPILIFFANAIAISIYVSIDTTMIGWIKGDYDVGIYSLAVKLYIAVKSIMIAIYNVSIPRLAYLWKNEDKEGFRKLFTSLFGYISILLIPATLGLFIVSQDALVLLGGEEYIQSVSTLQILSVALTFAIFGGLVCDCLNVAIGREKDNMIAAIIASLLNFLLNLWLIPLISYVGAAITTLISEAFVVVFCFLRIPNKSSYLEAKPILKSLVHAIIGSILMVVPAIIISHLVSSMVIRLILTIIFSVIAYCLFMVIIRDYFFTSFIKNIFKHFKKEQ